MLFIAYTTRTGLHLHSYCTALHCSTPLDYRLITVVGLLVQGSLVYTHLSSFSTPAHDINEDHRINGSQTTLWQIQQQT